MWLSTAVEFEITMEMYLFSISQWFEKKWTWGMCFFKGQPKTPHPSEGVEASLGVGWPDGGYRIAGIYI